MLASNISIKIIVEANMLRFAIHVRYLLSVAETNGTTTAKNSFQIIITIKIVNCKTDPDCYKY